MRNTEIEALGEIAGEALAAGGTFVREMHEGIAGRPFDALGAAAMPARQIHDGISVAVYAGVRAALRGAARGSARQRPSHRGPPRRRGAVAGVDPGRLDCAGRAQRAMREPPRRPRQ